MKTRKLKTGLICFQEGKRIKAMTEAEYMIYQACPIRRAKSLISKVFRYVVG